MDILGDFQRLSVVSKVCSELDNHFGANEEHRTLAEFIIDVVTEAETAKEAKEAILEGDDEFPQELIDSLYHLVKRMAPAPAPTPPPPPSPPPPPAAAAEQPPLPPGPRPEEERGERRGGRGDDERRGGGRDRRGDGREGYGDVRDRRERDYDRGSGGGGGGGMSADQRLERERKTYDLAVYCVYEGRVSGLKDYGAFVMLEKVHPEGWRVAGKKEGLCHISRMNCPGSDVREHLKRDQRVFVKIMGKTDRKLDLDMKEVDQETGEDLRPRKMSQREPMFGPRGSAPAEPENISGLTYVDDRTAGAGRKRKSFQGLTGDEQWEVTQLRKIGAGFGGVSSRDDPLYKEGRGIMEDVDEAEDLDVQVERQDKAPSFLKGLVGPAGSKLQLSPVKLVKNSDSALLRAGEAGRKFAKERREIKDDEFRKNANVDSRTLSHQNEDPEGKVLLTATARGQAMESQQSAMPGEEPEWKKQSLGLNVRFGKVSTASIQQQRQSLPIFAYREQIIDAVASNQCLVVIGETGSGKTTQMTQYLVECGFVKKNSKVGCTQPRRVAASSVSKRVAEEFGCKFGEEVGYAIRFEDMTSPNTIIKYMTDGMLLRELLIDANLKTYKVIMLDEAHERTVNTDVLFGLLKSVVQRRKDLHLIITSATLDAEKFSNYFGGCPILTIPGRTFPVEILHSNDDEPDYLDRALTTALQIHIEEPPGDILLFLTGQEEIDTAGEKLHEYVKKLGPKVPELLILPIYAQLPSEMQTKVFEPAPPGARKIVIATNIAEASITIDGIYYVIDPGLSKQKRFNPKLGMDSLDVAPISQASARQRAGRAGRTGPGTCYRLYTEDEFQNNMLPMSVPEIQRTNLSSTVLMLKAMGIHDLISFPFMDPPPQDTLVMSMESLYALGALDDEGLLTKLGRRMSEFPLEPTLSKVLIVAVDFGCAEDVTTVVAMIQAQNIFYRPKAKQTEADQKKAKFHQPEGDMITLLTIYNAWRDQKYSSPWCFDNYLQSRSLKRAQDIRKQLVLILEKHKLSVRSAGKNYNCIRKAIASGFFFHAAKRDPQDGYRTVTEDQVVFIHPSSSLFQKNPEWVIYYELVLTTKEYMREIMAIEPHWLPEVAPNFFRSGDPNKVSKKKMQEKIEPLFNKFENPGDWRLSKAMKLAAKLKRSTG